MDTPHKKAELSKLLSILEDAVRPGKVEAHLESQRQKREEDKLRYPRRFHTRFSGAKNRDLTWAGMDKSDPDYKQDVLESETRAVLSSLKERDQIIIKLYYGFEGGPQLSYSKIGEILGMTKQGVMKAVRRIQGKTESIVK